MANSFVWGGQTWGPGDQGAFIDYLNAHGTDYSTWAENHPGAAAIFSEGAPGPQQEPLPKSVGESLVASEAAGATPAEAAAAAEALAEAQQAQGFGAPTGDQLEQAAQDVAQEQAQSSGPSSPAPEPSTPAPTAPPLVQVSFSHDDLVNLWLYVGGPAGVADIAAAIALAESHGCKYAKAGPNDDRPSPQCVYRQTDGENSYGLWQINQRAHPSYSADDLYDAVGNARAALAVSNGGSDFGPWTTYTSGAFTQYLTGSPSSSSVFSAGTTTVAVNPTQPAGVAAAWSNLIGQYATGVPAANTSVGQLANSLTDIFKG